MNTKKNVDFNEIDLNEAESYFAEQSPEDTLECFEMLILTFLESIEVEKIVNLITTIEQSEFDESLKCFIINILQDKMEFDRAQFIGSGINLPQKSVKKMLEFSESNCSELSFKDFAKNICSEEMSKVVQLLGYSLKRKDGCDVIQDDEDISYFKSLYDGKQCYYISKDDVVYVFA
jgi:hypothetical protein